MCARYDTVRFRGGNCGFRGRLRALELWKRDISQSIRFSRRYVLRYFDWSKEIGWLIYASKRKEVEKIEI